MIKATQGFKFKYIVKSLSTKLVIKGDNIKIVLDTIEEEAGTYSLNASAEETSSWQPGEYKYQLLNDDGIEDSGEFIVLRNYMLADENESVKTHYEILLDAINAQIAGKATTAQQAMSVGDKSISYCSIDELFKLRDYFSKKVAEEKGEYNTDGNEMKIKYKWGIR